MNIVINKIVKIIKQNISIYLPEVKPIDLEENGTIYYMNGKNGTAFDWYVNEHLPSFMVFYNDEQNLGAVKLSIYTDGRIDLYIYGDNGKKTVKELNMSIDITHDELLRLAVVLKNEADDKNIWDRSIDKINTDIDIDDKKIVEFQNFKKLMEPSKNRIHLLNKMAYVSKKVLEDGWRVGYMLREEPMNENDSGWQLLAGDENDEYLNDFNNCILVYIHEVYQLDPDIWNYIDNPVGTKLIRISSNEFEIDKRDKEIFMEKRDT